ncbi:MAG: hypothetical protein II990_04200, partial [Muribaculaceae bacterium]|nr:hypothetical protein [Muribaculaceae bacterium]
SNGALTHRYYVRDYLGSTRAVIDESGNVLQSTAYYPSGVPLTPNSLTPQTIKLHTGKDFFDLQGAGWYDNQARYYDCLIPTFKSIDPLAEKYPWLSPYNHCANNPLKHIDLNGDSIAVLNLGGVIGHIGLLIQNENKKWNYYSVNGDNLYIMGTHKGGREFDDLGVGEFDSPTDFLNSSYNQKTENSKNDKNYANYDYESAYLIPTTTEQDNIIRTEFIKISKTEDYSINPLAPNHCGTAVQRSLQKAGIKVTSERTIPSNGTSIGKRNKVTPFFPNDIYNTIKQNNPYGTEYKK